YREGIAHDPRDGHIWSNLLFALHYDPDYDPATIFAEHVAWASRQAEPLAGLLQPHANDPNPARRLRIGYVSPDFRLHVMGSYSQAVIAAHDPTNFEIYCYAEVSHPDHVTERIRASADAWHTISGMSDEEVTELIRRDRIDILVDLTGHTGGGRLLV